MFYLARINTRNIIRKKNYSCIRKLVGNMQQLARKLQFERRIGLNLERINGKRKSKEVLTSRNIFIINKANNEISIQRVIWSRRIKRKWCGTAQHSFLRVSGPESHVREVPEVRIQLRNQAKLKVDLQGKRPGCLQLLRRAFFVFRGMSGLNSMATVQRRRSRLEVILPNTAYNNKKLHSNL